MNSWSQNKADSGIFPLRGVSTIRALDSLNAVVPIDYLRLANIKLTHRKYLIETNKQLEIKNSLHQDYIKEQDKIIKELQMRIQTSNKINEDLGRNLESQKKWTYICGGLAGAAIITTVIVLLIPDN